MNRLILRAILAALPVLGFACQSRSGFVYGVVGAGFLLAATFIFFLVRTLLPRTVERLGFLLLLLLLVTTAAKIFSVSFLLLVSLLLLTPPELFQKRRRWTEAAKTTIWTSFIFLILLAAHGLAAELSLRAGIQFFQHPAGSYFLAGLTLAGFSNPLQSRSRK